MLAQGEDTGGVYEKDAGVVKTKKMSWNRRVEVFGLVDDDE